MQSSPWSAAVLRHLMSEGAYEKLTTKPMHLQHCVDCHRLLPDPFFLQYQ